LAVKKYLNNPDAILVPNLTYLPRATRMPKNSLVDGSVAILIPKNKIEISIDNLNYWSSNEFRDFYRICRNHSSRSMNIDSNYVFYFGILK
jgi:DNA (cytosine-5)-methyltransferase 1